MSDQIRAIETEAFDQEVLGADKPVLVDFYADWCAPCKTVAPLVEALARNYGGRIDVKKVDVDRNPELAKQFGIRGIPTLLLFKDGTVAGSLVGAATQGTLNSLIDDHLD